MNSANNLNQKKKDLFYTSRLKDLLHFPKQNANGNRIGAITVFDTTSTPRTFYIKSSDKLEIFGILSNSSENLNTQLTLATRRKKGAQECFIISSSLSNDFKL